MFLSLLLKSTIYPVDKSLANMYQIWTWNIYLLKVLNKTVYMVIILHFQILIIYSNMPVLLLIDPVYMLGSYNKLFILYSGILFSIHW
jgi:hypothetical protein